MGEQLTPQRRALMVDSVQTAYLFMVAQYLNDRGKVDAQHLNLAKLRVSHTLEECLVGLNHVRRQDQVITLNDALFACLLVDEKAFTTYLIELA